jgi:hypothetical protein
MVFCAPQRAIAHKAKILPFAAHSSANAPFLSRKQGLTEVHLIVVSSYLIINFIYKN